MNVEIETVVLGEKRKSFSVFTNNCPLASAEFSAAVPELRKSDGRSGGDTYAGRRQR
jgi:hypothetical protein